MKALLLIFLLLFNYSFSQETVFELLNSNQTGVEFNNVIEDKKEHNILLYANYYGGGGVGIADFDNDGLQDLYFGGNLVADKIYRNLGDFKFLDKTENSGISDNGSWSSGITIADINNDGLVDVYVSKELYDDKPELRRNKLYINKGNFTFEESSKKWGVDVSARTRHAVFFDYNNDGHLDLYLLNQPPNPGSYSKFFGADLTLPEYSLQLFKNTGNNSFIDVTQEAGLKRTGFPNSVVASDLNQDGYVDLYVANDFDAPDFLYYNNGDGTFSYETESSLKHTSFYSMGVDSADINNDGELDVMVVDMTAEDNFRLKSNMSGMNPSAFWKVVENGGHFQYMFNTLQINNGDKTFSDVAQYTKTSSTDWSWANLIADFDNDGLKDIYVTNGLLRDIRNTDADKKVGEFVLKIADDYVKKNKSFDYNLWDILPLDKALELVPSVKIKNYLYKNYGNLDFKNETTSWGLDQPSFSNGASYADLDNDGDLDIVSNNMETEASIYKNNTNGNFLKVELEGSSNNTFSYGAKVIIYHNNKIQIEENTVTRGYFSSKEPKLFFGLGKEERIDSMRVIWPDNKTLTYNNLDVNKTIKVKYSKASELYVKNKNSNTVLVNVKPEDVGLDYIHNENEFDDFAEEVLLPHKLSNNGPFSASGDVNNDGLDDVFIGGASGQEGVLFIQTDERKFTRSKSKPWVVDKESEDLGALFFDLDGDGDKDLYVTSGGSEFKKGNKLLKDRIYINDGLGNFSKNNSATPNVYESTQTVKASDIDADGDLDLFIGTRLISGKYTFPATSYILINDKGILKKASNNVAPDLTNIGMVTDAVFSDIDNDNDEDLVVVGEWMKVKILENNDGKFKDNSNKFGDYIEKSRGLWWSITANDIDNDGDDDYIIGNLGKNNKFKASKEHPFKVYANDFDGNGTNDVVLAKYYKDGYVPMRGKECTTQQMPYVGEKFKDFHSFASSKLIDILPEKKIDEGIVYEISDFKSIILINNNGILDPIYLPIQAQTSPIKSSLVEDFNNDGFKDLLLVGNHYGVEVETVRYDAGYGSIFLGDGKNNFRFLPPLQSGIYIPKDSRFISSLKTTEEKNIYLSTNNDSAINLFKKSN